VAGGAGLGARTWAARKIVARSPAIPNNAQCLSQSAIISPKKPIYPRLRYTPPLPSAKRYVARATCVAASRPRSLSGNGIKLPQRRRSGTEPRMGTAGFTCKAFPDKVGYRATKGD
jgi:hypothetical protein